MVNVIIENVALSDKIPIIPKPMAMPTVKAYVQGMPGAVINAFEGIIKAEWQVDYNDVITLTKKFLNDITKHNFIIPSLTGTDN